MSLSRNLTKLANLLGRASVYVRDAAALSSFDLETIARRAMNRYISDRNKSTYIRGRNDWKRKK